METTLQLQHIIEKALARVPEKERREAVEKSCARTFQALRIDVNSEFEVLESFLKNYRPFKTRRSSGNSYISFRGRSLVKKSFKQLYREGIYREISTEVIRAVAVGMQSNGWGVYKNALGDPCLTGNDEN